MPKIISKKLEAKKGCMCLVLTMTTGLLSCFMPEES